MQLERWNNRVLRALSDMLVVTALLAVHSWHIISVAWSAKGLASSILVGRTVSNGLTKRQSSCFKQPREEPFSCVPHMPSLFSLHFWALELAKELGDLIAIGKEQWSMLVSLNHSAANNVIIIPSIILCWRMTEPLVTASSVSLFADVWVFCNLYFRFVFWHVRHSWTLEIRQEYICNKDRVMVLEITWQMRAGNAHPYSRKDFSRASLATCIPVSAGQHGLCTGRSCLVLFAFNHMHQALELTCAIVGLRYVARAWNTVTGVREKDIKMKCKYCVQWSISIIMC